MQSVRGAYDFVIVDSPPVLAVTDAVVLAREVDGVVLVMRDRTHRVSWCAVPATNCGTTPPSCWAS